ncbi:NRDE family protein [Lysobacter sp. SG-8]|uniref:NRDE family protein n=2 Tax=Marilutibacter penaei TaxID=2759900 RepID=A0A7W3U245_9GAMM|nr:NRDE family protein [Lysobacter penaei]
MCLIALAWLAHPRYDLALIANRDERHARPASAAGFDPEHPDVFGGRDRVQGGSWLLASSRRRFSAVTNVRAGLQVDPAPRSRGDLVSAFVSGTATADAWVRDLARLAPDYGRFNQLAWDGRSLAFASNHPSFQSRSVTPGLHAMSNGAFDAPWPKSGHASLALERWLDSAPSRTRAADDAASLSPLLEALADTAPAPDARLPDTGVGLALERRLSPAFVLDPVYGTRCSTVVLVEAAAITFFERRFDPDGTPTGDTLQVLESHGP